MTEKMEDYIINSKREYLEDVLMQIFPNEMPEITYFSSILCDDDADDGDIYADIIVRGRSYTVTLGYKVWALQGYDTDYGMFVVKIVPERWVSKNDFRLYLVNPVTAEVDIHLSLQDERRFFCDLSRWPDLSRCRRDYRRGKVPKPISVILEHVRNKYKPEGEKLGKEKKENQLADLLFAWDDVCSEPEVLTIGQCEAESSHEDPYPHGMDWDECDAQLGFGVKKNAAHKKRTSFPADPDKSDEKVSLRKRILAWQSS